jgi:hypothetical protein
MLKLVFLVSNDFVGRRLPSRVLPRISYRPVSDLPLQQVSNFVWRCCSCVCSGPNSGYLSMVWSSLCGIEAVVVHSSM